MRNINLTRRCTNKQKLTLQNHVDIAYKQLQEKIRINMSTEEKRANDLAQMKGASCLVKSLPLNSENYTFEQKRVL